MLQISFGADSTNIKENPQKSTEQSSKAPGDAPNEKIGHGGEGDNNTAAVFVAPDHGGGVNKTQEESCQDCVKALTPENLSEAKRLAKPPVVKVQGKENQDATK